MNSLLFALVLAMAPADSSPQMEEAAVLYQDGTTMFKAADYTGAIDKFTMALGIVSSIDGDERTQLTLLYNIASAHEKQFEIDKDIAHLRQALQLYRRYEEFVAGTGEFEEEWEVEPRITSLENKLKTHDQIQRNREEAKREGPPPPPRSVVTDDLEWKKPRNLGIGLVVTGGAATIGGVVMAVLGSRFEGNAQVQVDKLADMGVPMDDPAWAQGEKFVEDEKHRGNILMGVGATVAVVGAAGVGVGSYYLIKSKRLHEGSVAVLPALSPSFAGVRISGRF